MIEQPSNIEAIQTLVAAHDQIRIQGAGTKSSSQPTLVLDMTALSGIIEYDPFEYTFTAYAGTPVKVIQAALSEHSQYLPCDPLLTELGATLGGTIAANTAGSRRYRYGSIRDFVLGATVIDGQARVLHVGGKVVKNAAGFDLAKFYVGSLGQYGILTDVTFKVFPEPPQFATICLTYDTIIEAVKAVFFLTRQPLDIDAVDLEQDVNGWKLVVRFGGRGNDLPKRLANFTELMQANTSPMYSGRIDDDATYWDAVNRCDWAQGYTHLIKMPIAPGAVAGFDDTLSDGIQRRYTVAGNIAWLATNDFDLTDTFDRVALVLAGPNAGTVLGTLQGAAFAQRVKAVLDPHAKFS